MSRKKSSSLRGEISALQKELERERRRSAALEREVTALKRQLREAESRENPLRGLRRPKGVDAATRRREGLQTAAARRAQHYRRGSFLRYAYESVMDSVPVRILAQLWAYLRRLRVVQFVLTLVPAVGAVILVSALSAAALPFLVLGTGLLAILGTLRAKRRHREMQKALAGKHIRVLIPARKTAPFRHDFFVGNAKDLARGKNVAVVIVSPYAFSTRGLSGRGAYFTARREDEDIYLVRRYYFFSLRHRVLDAIDPGMTVIY